MDVTAPETTIESGPADRILPEAPALFVFSSSEPNATYECALDTPAGEEHQWNECENPADFTTEPAGPHTLYVRAVDLADPPNADPTPAEYGWTVIGPPTTTITVRAGRRDLRAQRDLRVRVEPGERDLPLLARRPRLGAVQLALHGREPGGRRARARDPGHERARHGRGARGRARLDHRRRRRPRYDHRARPAGHHQQPHRDVHVLVERVRRASTSARWTRRPWPPRPGTTAPSRPRTRPSSPTSRWATTSCLSAPSTRATTRRHARFAQLDGRPGRRAQHSGGRERDRDGRSPRTGPPPRP